MESFDPKPELNKYAGKTIDETPYKGVFTDPRLKDIISGNGDKLELIAKSLLEYETLDGQQVEEIIRTGKFTPPPPRPDVDAPHGAPAGTPLPEVPGKPAQPKLPGLGSPAPATA